MAKLKISEVEEDKLVTLTVKLPNALHRDLIGYAEAIKCAGGKTIDPASLVAAMLKRFMASDRAFAKWRRQSHKASDG
jgi:hypothetical protein